MTRGEPEGSQIVTIDRVQLNPTETGFEILLLTPTGTAQQLRVVNVSQENNFIAEIQGAQINLPNAQPFRAENPIEGVSEVTVTNQNENTVLVTVVGEEKPPIVEFFDSEEGLIFSATSETQTAQEEEIELVVTGEQDGYRVPNATTATRTDTPIRDIPQSIQVVPRQVLEDRGVRRELEALETVSGVVDIQANLFDAGGVVNIRGFQSNTRLRNGLASEGIFYIAPIPIGTVEQVEVLKGPASVLFGAVEPGGVVNYVTRQPLPEPNYKIGFEAGNYGLYQPTIDLSGPLTQDKSVLYRLIASYQGGGNYKDEVPVNNQRISIAPSITFNIGDRTSLNLYYEYDKYRLTPSAEPLLSDGSLIPRNIYPLYFSSQDNESHRIGYALNHRFSESWQLRHNLSINLVKSSLASLEYTNLLEDRFLTDFFGLTVSGKDEVYAGQIDLVGNFRTGSISHQLLAGFDLTRQLSYYGDFSNTFDLPPLDIRNPNYDVPLPELPFLPFGSLRINQSYGVYLQDQIAFSDNLKMLIGGRYDWLTDENGPIDGDRTSQNDGAFSPRIGLVYQPNQNVSLYASYSQSFRPSIGQNPDSRPFEPTRGTQYEVGVKADFLNGKLSTTLALYNLTKTNVLTPDPDPELARQGFQVQVGEQRSRGVELDVAGEILPGWKVIASYAFTDAEVTADNSTPSTVSQPLRGVPKHQASLWSTYTIQKGDLQGLGFGLGLFYVGERQDNFGNSAQLASYLRTDAALYYRRNGFNAAINVRNLFNTDYVSSPNFGTLFINRGTPLTIVGSISWEF
ncbi:TonB-dependent siderophore receptor [Candidatus Gracilibacteria bacterium]|nr:TonB-dependent siderophore receptor [Candidatus Gracilibacteria bacterium]